MTPMRPFLTLVQARWYFPRRRALLALVAMAGLGGAVAPALSAAERSDIDVVVLSNGHQITGRVTHSTPDRVTIEQDHGEAQLPRRLVQAVHLGFDSRLARLDRNDYQAVLALAQWAQDHDMNDAAERLARMAYALSDRDGRSALMIARLLDAKVDGQADALEYYRAYRDRFGGSDPEALARLDDLERHFRSFEEQLAAYQERLAQAQESHVDGLEARAGWQGDDPQHANQITVEQRTIEESGIENVVLQVQYQAGGQDKAILRRRVTFDATVHRHVSFEVSNPEANAIPVSIAVKAGPGYDYFESTTVTVPPTDGGWHPVSFSLVSNDWKSQATGWAHSGRIEHAENVRELQIQFHNRRRNGTVFVDAIPLLR